jgi:hypothetical protein
MGTFVRFHLTRSPTSWAATVKRCLLPTTVRTLEDIMRSSISPKTPVRPLHLVPLAGLVAASLILIPLGVRVLAHTYPSGIISYWNLDEGSGAVADDTVGVSVANVSGAAWTAGQVNAALQFDGTGDYAQAVNAVFPIATVEAWVKLDSYPATYRYGIVAASTNPGCTFSEILEVDPSGKASFYHWDGTAIRRPVGTTTLQLGQWYHLAATLQYPGYLTLYVNGQPEASMPIVDSHQDYPQVVFSFAVACWGYLYSHESFNGALDEVAIYSSALSAEEIRQHYQNGLEGLGYEVVLRPEIDIKPGSYPNSINLESAGAVPVAILSSATFDAQTVNPDTVSLAGARVKLVGKSSRYLCRGEDVNGDGLVDLVCHVETAQFMIEPGESVAILEAETFDGTSVRGKDSVTIVR